MMTNEEIDHLERQTSAAQGLLRCLPGTFRDLCAQAKLANKYPHLPVEPPGCPTPGACSAVRFVAEGGKGMPAIPEKPFSAYFRGGGGTYTEAEFVSLGDWAFDVQELLTNHALSLAAQLADLAEVEKEYDKVKLVVERSGLEPAPASTMAIKPLHLRVQDLLAQLAEVRGGEQDHIAVVINNNQPGWTNIVETAPNITLDVGTKLFLGEQ